MNERIIAFIQGQKVATVCCVDEEHKPYCFSCFYAFDVERQLLYFKTSVNTHHVQILLQNNQVAGTIQPDKLNPLAVKGIQFTGVIAGKDDLLSVHAVSVYHKKYPFALAMSGDVWVIRLTTIKMTDNTLNFGKKILWELNQKEAAV